MAKASARSHVKVHNEEIKALLSKETVVFPVPQSRNLVNAINLPNQPAPTQSQLQNRSYYQTQRSLFTAAPS
jgi:hypothetical protein